MFRADYHTHSEYSSDSSAVMEDVIVAAIKKGQNEIALTDHIDLDYPPVTYAFWEQFDLDKYENERRLLKQKYSDRIEIVCGIEMGLQPGSKKIIDDFMSSRTFDFVIGSTHCVDRKDLYECDFSRGKTQSQAYREYFEDVLKSVTSFDVYDVYGHLDVVRRYGNFDNRALNYEEYSGIIDEILVSIIEKDKGIEINSSGYRYGLFAPHPQFDIIKRYKELGGEIITTGSDAHSPVDVASHFGEIYKLLEEAGFKAVATFKNRKPDLVGFV